jgi:hypothetical protein
MEDLAMLCTRCDEKIPAERLEAIPETELCVKCSRDVGGDYKFEGYQEAVGGDLISDTFITKTKRHISPLKKKRA